MTESVIADRYFTKCNSAEEVNAHLEAQEIEWEPTMTPESFPCLAEFHLDEKERPYPVFFTPESLKFMSATLKC